MSGRLLRTCLVSTFAVGIFVTPALAADTDDVARLESLLTAQQQKIDVLEHQLAAAQDNVDGARAAQMKQQIREVLSEQAFRESLMPTTLQAGYDRGFFIRSSDDKFMIKFNALMQWRYTYYETRGRNHYLLPGFDTSRNRSGIDAARIRTKISGYAYDKDLTYLLELDMSEANTYDTGVQYAWVNYKFVDEFQVMAGVFRTHSTRADTESTGTMQFVEYPMMNAVFGLGRATGVRFWGKLLDGRGKYSLDIVNSLGSPRTRTITNDEVLYTQGHDNNPAVVFRTVWSLMGGHCLHPDDAGEWTAPCDMGFHDEPALNVGFHYAFTEDQHDGTLRMPYQRKTFFQDGGFGLTSSDGLQINQVGVDMGFKYMGFSATAEYVARMIDVRSAASAPLSPLFQLTGDDSTTVQHGAYVQCGYFLPIPGFERKFEVVGRVGGLTAYGGNEGTWTYAGGLNYYIQGHNVKLQTDITHVSEAPISSSQYSLANVNDDAWVWRVQLQVAF